MDGISRIICQYVRIYRTRVHLWFENSNKNSIHCVEMRNRKLGIATFGSRNMGTFIASQHLAIFMNSIHAVRPLFMKIRLFHFSDSDWHEIGVGGNNWQYSVSFFHLSNGDDKRHTGAIDSRQHSVYRLNK